MNESRAIPKILIADDNTQNVELLEAYLSDFDCDIRTANDGEETLRVVEEFQPDLLLLDIMMPRLSGFEVCRKIRSNPATKDLLILMVTALNEASDFERGVQAGTDDFLTKPVNKIELSAGSAASCGSATSRTSSSARWPISPSSRPPAGHPPRPEVRRSATEHRARRFIRPGREKGRAGTIPAPHRMKAWRPAVNRPSRSGDPRRTRSRGWARPIALSEVSSRV